MQGVYARVRARCGYGSDRFTPAHAQAPSYRHSECESDILLVVTEMLYRLSQTSVRDAVSVSTATR